MSPDLSPSRKPRAFTDLFADIALSDSETQSDNNNGILVFDKSHNIITYNSCFLRLFQCPSIQNQTQKQDLILATILEKVANKKYFVEEIVRPHTMQQQQRQHIITLKNGNLLECNIDPIHEEEEVIGKALYFSDISHIKTHPSFKTQQLTLHHEIIQQLPNLIWLKNPEGKYLACNKRFEAFAGATEAQLLGKTDKAFLVPHLQQLFEDHEQRAIATTHVEVHEAELTFASTGQREVIEITHIPIFNTQKTLLGVLGVGHNITARKTSEVKLKAREERFFLAMQGGNDGLWDWNLETDEVYYSPRWKNMLGYRADELGNDFSTFTYLIHPEDKAFVLARLQEYIFGTTTTFELEMRMRHRNGQDVFVLSRGFLSHRESDQKAVRLVGTHIDITARKRAEIFNDKNAAVLTMIATGKPATDIYNEIALMYEARHPGLRCSLLELEDGVLLHGGAPSLPKEYCDAVHGLRNGPDVGSCGTSTYTGKRVLVADIATDPKWAEIKHVALPHGMRSCWSEPIKNSSGKVLGAFGMYYNHPALPNEEELNDLISAARLAAIAMERDQAQKQIRRLAYTDALTGLSSRAHFYQVVEALINKCDHHAYCCSLLYIDLDDFKGVNDSLGHDVGDLLLREVAARLRQVSGTDDFVARLGGDEFCLLVQSQTEARQVIHVAERCLTEIARPLELCGRQITPACSIGIAHYPSDGQTLAGLLKAADTSLYMAKGKGKNQYASYQRSFTEKAEYRFQVEQCLRRAIEQEELQLVYQPQVQLSTGKIIGVEALSRWYHPQLGYVPPTEFIATAERIGMIKPLTEWALKTACNQAVTWRKVGLPELHMAVNVSPRHFLDDDFVDLVRSVLTETGMMAPYLSLEVTESVVQTNPKNMIVFQELRDLGVMLAIDDFGTGYSSFASLKHIEVNYLKIDKYFTHDMIFDQKSQCLMHSMIKMGQNLELGIIVEGVETIEQCDLLYQLGCSIAQGYYFSKPMPANEVEQLLIENLKLNKILWPNKLVA